MKITDVTVTLFKWEISSPKSYDRASKVQKVTDLGLVRVITDEGLEGHGLLGMGPMPASIDAAYVSRILKPLLVGENPLHHEAVYQKMFSRAVQVRPWSICAVDVALWDLAGKIAGLPIHALLGTCREKIPTYASSEQHPTINGFVEQALSVKEAGLHGYKIHPNQDWREDIAVCRAVREAVGKDFNLMLDSRGAYSLGEAVKVGRVLEELNFRWYEDPLDYRDIYNYTKLVPQMDIPVCVTEFPEGWYTDYAPWIMNKATDMLRGDVYLKGGITPIIKLAHLAEAFGMKVELHHGCNALCDVANLHVQMSVMNTSFAEVLLPHEAWWYGLVENIQIDSEGYMHAPTKPGLGYEMDLELVDHNKIAVLS